MLLEIPPGEGVGGVPSTGSKRTKADKGDRVLGLHAFHASSQKKHAENKVSSPGATCTVRRIPFWVGLQGS
eukprot:1161859-Pelagomonas_calceolata.AAC.13